MKKSRPVFESYSEFVSAIKDAINEASETGGNIDSLNKLLGGGLKMSSENLSQLKKIIDSLNSMMTPAAATTFKDVAENISDYFSSGEAGIKPAPAQLGTVDPLASFNWLVNGTVRVKGEPSILDDGDIQGIGMRMDDTSVNTPLSDVLRGIFLYNLAIVGEMVNQAKSSSKKEKIWKESNGGKKGDSTFKGFAPFLKIDEASLKGDIIQVIPETTTIGSEGSYEYGFGFNIYTVRSITKGAGRPLGTETYEEVIKPAGNDTEVTDKPYSSSGANFFAENAVEISDEGMASLKAILSQFNSITTIKVNGGASSKPTSRAGGNEKLAKDRQAAGIKALEALKKDGVEQLKGAKIEAGEAKVQDASEESDPKNQQVSFVISGMIKNVEGTDNKEIVITKTSDLRADRVVIDRRYFSLVFNVNA